MLIQLSTQIEQERSTPSKLRRDGPEKQVPAEAASTNKHAPLWKSMSAARCLARLLQFSQPSSYDSLCRTWGAGQNTTQNTEYSHEGQVQQFRFLSPFPAALLPRFRAKEPRRYTLKHISGSWHQGVCDPGCNRQGPRGTPHIFPDKICKLMLCLM